MSGRRWAALAVVAALAAIGAMLLECGRTDVAAPTSTSHAASPQTTQNPAAETPAKPRRRAAAADESPKSASENSVDATAKTTVVVHVTAKADGKPVAGADVELDEENDGKDDVAHHADTDDAGVARFVDLPPCTAMVNARAEGFVRSEFTGERAKAGDELTIDVALERGEPLEGVVRDASSGRPIVGAKVVVEVGGSLEGFGSTGSNEAPYGVLATGDDGRFHLRVPPDVMVTPSASAAGFVPAKRTVIVNAGVPHPPVELRLESAGVLRGTVRAPNGTAVVGAAVYAVQADRRNRLVEPHLGDEGVLFTTSDALGRYELNALALGGAYVAIAAAQNFGRSEAHEGVLVTDASPVAEWDFALRGFGTVVVQVVDPDGETPKGRVTAFRQYGNGSEGHKLDERGMATFDHVDPGQSLVWAIAESFPIALARGIDVREGETIHVTVRLSAGASISGVAVDDLGQPIVDARAYAIGTRSTQDWPDMASHGSAATASDGTFRIDSLHPEPHRVVVRAERHADAEVTIDTSDESVRLVLPRFGSVTLHLVVPPGAAPPDTITPRVEVPTATSPGGVASWSGGGATSVPFGDGCVTVPAPPGVARVRVISAGFAPVVRQFETKPGEAIDLGDVVLDAGVDVAGRVEDAAGAPVVGARVTVGGSYAGDTVSPDVRLAKTDAAGAFRLAHLAGGPTRITVAAPEFVPATVVAEAAPGGGALVVRVFRGALLTVTAVDAAGAPLVGATIHVAAADGADDTTCDADYRGRCTLRVAPGKRRVSVDGRGASAVVDLVEGGEASVRLVAK